MIFTFKKNNHRNWEEWFAWYPVRIDNMNPNKTAVEEYREETWYWLEKVCRRQYHGYGSGKKRVWTYASIFDVLMESNRKESEYSSQVEAGGLYRSGGVVPTKPSPAKLTTNEMLALIKCKETEK